MKLKVVEGTHMTDVCWMADSNFLSNLLLFQVKNLIEHYINVFIAYKTNSYQVVGYCNCKFSIFTECCICHCPG